MAVPTWRTGVDAAMLARRAGMLREVREFFHRRGVLEVDTPQLAPTTIPDPAIESLRVSDGTRPLGYLQTSPEFAMKRLLAAGSPDIYQLGHVFRAGEHGRHHRREFTLLEWYRRGWSEFELMAEVAALIRVLVPATADWPIVHRRYDDVLAAHAGVTATCDVGRLAAALEHAGIAVPDDADAATLLDLLIGARVNPALGHGEIEFVHAWPVEQAALAAIDPGPPPTAARFEVFVHGMELGNGFRELGDADEQRARFERERAYRRARARHVPPLDERLLAALAHGLPDCAGVAMGFDRLVMLAGGCEDIACVLALDDGDIN